MKTSILLLSLLLPISPVFSSSETVLQNLVITCFQLSGGDEAKTYLCLYDKCHNKEFSYLTQCKDLVKQLDSKFTKEQLQQIRQKLK